MPERKQKPQIRFEEFSDIWELCKLEDIVEQRIEHQKISSEAPLLAFSYAEGVINPEDKKTNKRDFIMTDKYNKIFSRTEKDDIIYNPANVIHGAIHRNKLGTGVVSPIYKIFKCKNASPKFVGECLHRDKFIEKITKYIEGTVIKLRTLSPEQFLKMQIKLPVSIDEQEKIGTFISKLDNLITLHQRKYEKLMTMKKSCLEKMFPKNENKNPEIRFKGFSDVWEECRLDDRCSIITKQTGFDYSTTIKPSLLNEPETNTYPFIQNKDFDGLSINYNTDFYIPKSIAETFPKILIDRPSLLISISGKIGNVGLYSNKKKAFIGGAVGICKLKNQKDGLVALYDLLSQSGQKYFMSLIKASSHSNITVEDIRKIPIDIPKDDAEKERIGEFFTAIDNLITLHQRKLKMLQNIKKSCLEKMFV